MRRFGLKLLADRWHGASYDNLHVDAPDSVQIAAAIGRLDARVYTQVIVAGPEEAHLCVGGGDGRYVVYATWDNLTFFNLLSSEGGEVVRLVTGGQEGVFDAVQVVSVDMAVRAASRFAEDGALDDALRWAEG